MVQESILNKKELKILKLISKGKTNIQIAIELKISIHTVKAYVARILNKLKVKDRLQAVIKGIKENIIDI